MSMVCLEQKRLDGSLDVTEGRGRSDSTEFLFTGMRKKEKESALEHNNHLHLSSAFGHSLTVLPITFLSPKLHLLPALHLKCLSVSVSLTCYFLKIKYMSLSYDEICPALFPSPFDRVFQRKTRLAHCSPVLTVKLSLVIKLLTLLLPDKLPKSLCDC